MTLVEIGGTFQNDGPLTRRRAIPGRRGAVSASKRSIELPRTRRDDGPDLAPPVARIEDRLYRARLLDPPMIGAAVRGRRKASASESRNSASAGGWFKSRPREFRRAGP